MPTLDSPHPLSIVQPQFGHSRTPISGSKTQVEILWHQLDFPQGYAYPFPGSKPNECGTEKNVRTVTWSIIGRTL